MGRGLDVEWIQKENRYEAQLAWAREKAEDAGEEIEFRQLDARDLPFDSEFDAAIMLCEGGFSLMETDEMNFEILKNVTEALKGKGKIIFTTLNGLFPLYNSVEEFCGEAGSEGNAVSKGNTFDLMTFRDYQTTEFEDDGGNKKELKSNERFYVPSEITYLIRSCCELRLLRGYASLLATGL